jgi:hypothetical protein
MIRRESYPMPPAEPDVIVTRPGDDPPVHMPLKAEPLLHRLRGRRSSLRLVRGDEAEPAVKRQPPAAAAADTRPRRAITDPADPRWVLAIRTAESLQGTILGPEKRDRLVKLGKLLGMTGFDANLVIAIVQDQARRGYAPDFCPTAGESQLAMVPLPREGESDVEKRVRRIGVITGMIMLIVGIEMMVLKWVFS